MLEIIKLYNKMYNFLFVSIITYIYTFEEDCDALHHHKTTTRFIITLKLSKFTKK